MKKATILMTLVLLLSICGVGVLAADVFEAHDQVVLTEKTVYGDRSKADGLTVRLDSHYSRRLFWNTSMKLDEGLSTATEYVFSAKQIREDYPVEHRGIGLSNRVHGGVEFDLDNPQEGLWVAYKELYDETEPGQEKETDILLKDYIDHYPMTIELDFPDAEYSAEAWKPFDGMEALPSSEIYAIQALRDYFKIPVLEDEHYQIHVRKRENGMQSGWGGGTSQYGDRYYMFDYSVLSDDACYFTFSTTTDEGEVVDLSELPDGYGIYRLPYQTEYNEQRKENVSVIDVDNLEMVYPLEPGIELSSLSMNKEQTCLYLHAVQDGKYSITVIDIASMKTLQKLDITEVEEDSWWSIWNQDDFMVIELSPTQELVVMSIAENGELQVEYICPILPEDFDGFSIYGVAMDFDGERLVCVRPLEIEEEYEGEYRDRTTCNLQVAVYEEEGLVYFGEYTNSLDTGENWANHSFYVRVNDFNPVVATWTR